MAILLYNQENLSAVTDTGSVNRLRRWPAALCAHGDSAMFDDGLSDLSPTHPVDSGT